MATTMGMKEALESAGITPYYSIKHRSVLKSGELYIRHCPVPDLEGVIHRLKRPTFSHSAKYFPRNNPSRSGIKVLIDYTMAPFTQARDQKVKSITDRVTRPTKSSKIRSKNIIDTRTEFEKAVRIHNQKCNKNLNEKEDIEDIEAADQQREEGEGDKEEGENMENGTSDILDESSVGGTDDESIHSDDLNTSRVSQGTKQSNKKSEKSVQFDVDVSVKQMLEQ